MSEVHHILVIQTAFAGDVILTIPLLQALKREHPSALLDVVVVPRTAPLLANHPAVNRVIPYDKRGRDAGVRGLRRMVTLLRTGKYDLALIPHRSIRSAVLAAWARIPLRVGFTSSAGRFLLTSAFKADRSLHEVDRNLSLLKGIGVSPDSIPRRELPRLYPSAEDVGRVEEFLRERGVGANRRLAAVAPGTVWNTKRWPKERFAELCRALAEMQRTVVLIGGTEDSGLCEEIVRLAASPGVISAAGRLTLLQSAELIRRCEVLVSNDSAPMHLALAVGTPVTAIYGATIPGFGFAPFGPRDTVIETVGLSCRPCSIHGGDRCPIGTFECMQRISAGDVVARLHDVLGWPR